jgi:L-fuconate dehydratase
VRLLDLSYLDEVLSDQEALHLIAASASCRIERRAILEKGYPGYDTSVGWIAYDDERVRELTVQAIDKRIQGF